MAPWPNSKAWHGRSISNGLAATCGHGDLGVLWGSHDAGSYGPGQGHQQGPVPGILGKVLGRILMLATQECTYDWEWFVQPIKMLVSLWHRLYHIQRYLNHMAVWGKWWHTKFFFGYHPLYPQQMQKSSESPLLDFWIAGCCWYCSKPNTIKPTICGWFESHSLIVVLGMVCGIGFTSLLCQ